MFDISVVIPVLGRPRNAEPVVASIRANSSHAVEVTFVCSPGDSDEMRAVHDTGENYIVVDWEPGPGDFARKQNLGFKHAEADFVLLAADDLLFEPGWDEAGLRMCAWSGKGVVGTQDDANPLVKRGRHSTHPIVSRRYIERVGGTWHDGPGVVYHEGYDHQWVDSELCQVAKDRDEWAFAHRCVIRHLHPMYPARGQARTEMDDTYRKGLANGQADMQIFLERQQRAKPAVR